MLFGALTVPYLSAISDKDFIKQRKSMMKAVGGTIGDLRAMVWGKA